MNISIVVAVIIGLAIGLGIHWATRMLLGKVANRYLGGTVIVGLFGGILAHSWLFGLVVVSSAVVGHWMSYAICDRFMLKTHVDALGKGE